MKNLKAYYIYLIRLYGPIVIADRTGEPFFAVEEVRQERQTVDSCFNSVLNSIDEVLFDANGSPRTELSVERESAFLGQVDQINARAIKAQVLITRASPLFNGNTEYFSNFRNKAGDTYFPMNPRSGKNGKERPSTASRMPLTMRKQGVKKLYTFIGQPKFWDVKNFEESEIIQYAYNKRFSIVQGVDKWNDELLWGYSGLDYEGQGGFAHATNMRSVADPTQAGYAWQWLGADYRMDELFYSKNGVPIEDDKTYDYSNRLQITEIPDDNYPQGLYAGGREDLSAAPEP